MAITRGVWGSAQAKEDGLPETTTVIESVLRRRARHWQQAAAAPAKAIEKTKEIRREAD